MKCELIPVRRLASGELLQIPVFRFAGKAEAPSVYLQASLHGSEVQGNWIIAELLERLQKMEILGNITLVPCANPYGQNHKLGDYTIGRFDPVDGENWNRAFVNLTSVADEVKSPWPQAKNELRALLLEKLSQKPAQTESHAKHLARTLQHLAASHDYMLDLHCAALCETYAYVPAYAFASFQDLPCRHAVRIGPEFSGSMDEAFFAPWWQLGKRLEAETGKFPPLPEGYTLEVGHQDWSDPELAHRQAEGILFFLEKRGIVRGKFEKLAFPQRFACDLKDFRTDFAPTGGFVKLKAKLGEVQEKGAPYCEFLQFKEFQKQTIACAQEQVTLVFTNASSVHEGTELGKSLTNFFRVPT